MDGRLMTVFAADEQADHPVDLEHLRRLARHVLGDQDVPDAMETSLLCVDAATIQRLNAHHMGSDQPTDVLAFPIDAPGESSPGGPAILGDVVICPAVAARNATGRGIELTGELELLVVHGLLHLLGHDHVADDERARMFTLTDRLLSDFRGVPVEGASSAAASDRLVVDLTDADPAATTPGADEDAR